MPIAPKVPHVIGLAKTLLDMCFARQCVSHHYLCLCRTPCRHRASGQVTPTLKMQEWEAEINRPFNPSAAISIEEWLLHEDEIPKDTAARLHVPGWAYPKKAMASRLRPPHYLDVRSVILSHLYQT